MLHRHPFWDAGRAGGIDDIGQRPPAGIHRTAQTRRYFIARIDVPDPDRVDRQHPPAVIGKLCPLRRSCQQRLRLSVAEDVGQSFFRVSGVESEIGATRLEHGQHRDQHVEGAVERDPDHGVPPDPKPSQGVSDRERASVELAIR